VRMGLLYVTLPVVFVLQQLQPLAVPHGSKIEERENQPFQHFRPDAIFYYKLLMLTAIYFNNYLLFKADKIENVIFVRVLSAKFQTFHLPAP